MISYSKKEKRFMENNCNTNFRKIHNTKLEAHTSEIKCIWKWTSGRKNSSRTKYIGGS